MKPKLTIGMAHFDDFSGAYFTIQSIRMYHPEVCDRIELIVVENNPSSPHARDLKNLVSGRIGNLAGTKHITYAANTGTSQARNAIIENATGEFVMILDCHVLIRPGAISRLLDFYEENPETKDIYSGPLMMDQLDPIYKEGGNCWTHFNDQWRGGMWGTWATSWKCECGKAFTVSDEKGHVKYREIAPPLRMIEACECGKEFPKIPWASHENALRSHGFSIHGSSLNDDPFEIPGQGLGLFTFRKDAWPGFNPHSRGFGGEELYIHEKFRRNGGKAMCLPFLQWLHRFGRPGGTPYPASPWNRVRNYVLEFNELGLPLDDVKHEFVRDGWLTEKQWNHLISDPIGNVEHPASSGCNSCNKNKSAKAENIESIEDAYKEIQNNPRDLDEHMDKLREYASNVERITEFSERRESAMAFIAAQPKSFVSHNKEKDAIVDKAASFLGDGTAYRRDTLIPDQLEAIDETDLLFLDYGHTYGDCMSQLQKFGKSTTRYIIFHDTHIYGEHGPNKTTGILPAIRQYVKENPEWSVIYHTNHQFGLTVLSRDERDKPKLPGKVTMAANFTKAMAKYAASGFENVPKEEYEKRLEICSLCPSRSGESCSVCGCPLAKKAAIKTEMCPLGHWMNSQ